MTKKFSGPLMDLDLDAFLQLHSSSDDNDDEDLDGIPHRTVDEILNDSSSSSSSSSTHSPSSFNSSVLRRRRLFDHSTTTTEKYSTEENNFREADVSTSTPDSISISLNLVVDETLESPLLEEKYADSKISSPSRWKSGDVSGNSFSLGHSLSRPFPPLFGRGRSNPKPGAALAAAAAASRSIPTPYAAAIKLRRASNSSLQKVLHAEELVSPVANSDSISDEIDEIGGLTLSDNVPNGLGSGIAQSDETVRTKIERTLTMESPAETNCNLEIAKRDEVAETSYEKNEICATEERPQLSNKSYYKEDLPILNSSTSIGSVEQNMITSVGDGKVFKVEDNSVNLNSTDIDEEANSSYAANENASKEDANSTISRSNSSSEKDLPSLCYDQTSKVEEDTVKSKLDTNNLEKDVSPKFRDGQLSVVGDDNISSIDMTDLVDDRIFQLESRRRSRRTGKKLRSSMKLLELAEELEKKHASSGLHWEEGAAAQPMRLKGIRRGPPAVGYLHIDPNNAITRTISSQAFKRDHGSPGVLAVHANFIAVGMTKGVVVVVPSKYSAHNPDNMESKMLMLGSQADKSHSPVTSMCFNQQGDLLLAGYGDGHITVWDVQRAAVAKVITGEHTAPVVHTLFLGQYSQVTRQFKAVTGDCKGLVLLHACSVVPLLNRFTIKTQCLLDGQKTGTVLSASPLLIDDSFPSALVSAQGNASASGIGSMVGGVVGGVVGGEAGWKLFSEGSPLVEEGVVIFVTNQTALVVRLSPTLEVYAQLSKPDGVREGSMPYTAWKCMTHLGGSSNGESLPGETLERASMLAIAWDRKVQVAKLVKSDLKVYREWSIDSAAIGLAWLDEQMLVVLTLRGQLCLFTKEGNELHRTKVFVDGSAGDDLVAYHTHFTNIFGNPEKAYNNCVAVRGATMYILGPMHLVVSRLLPWKERIQVLRKAGDWMGALDMAMRLYDGHAHGVIDLPSNLDAIREVIMPYLVELLLSYVDEVFSYISVAFCNQVGKVEESDVQKNGNDSVQSEMEEQFARVGGVAVEFCVHIKRLDILFDDIFSKFVAVQHGGTFLELLEPYILKDMLGCLPPEIMQELVEHYSCKGWLQRVEQCVLHMDISSLDFNQVVRLCREHGLYGALIYLFNKGLDDFKAPLEELLVVIQNSERENTAAIGYRMLVYLKYCFSGLAFPPGHGILPLARLPSLRTELVQFLLEESGSLNSEVATRFKSSTGVCPNLYHLLWLDTEATLEVLKYAFLEEEIPKPDHSLRGSVATNVEDCLESNSNIENQDALVQNTVNTLVHILDMELPETDGTSSMDDSVYLDVWPSKKDIGHLLEFIADFVACKRTSVSKDVLSHILEYLASERSVPPIFQNIEALKRREKQVLALLKVVPEIDWDSSYVLHLCEKAEFHQVCGLIHTVRGQYLAALDSYMKDVDEPIHAFSFINKLLLHLGDSEISAFQSAVISRIPELVNLSREGTFILVIDYFNKDSHHIMSELQSHPKSLFLYLKTIIEVHLSGTLNLSSLRKGDILDAPSGRRLTDQSNDIEAYSGRISEFPKLLRDNPVHVTDEMIELYLELLCQYERESVLKFLQTFESYRLEHCLRLCQQYGVIDAAAFLLERVGDVGSALLLTLSGLKETFFKLDTSLGTTVSEMDLNSLTETEHLDTVLRMKEVNAISEILHASIGLCQRNTQRLDPEESESLWFLLLDSFCEPLRDSYETKMVSKGENHVGMLATSYGIQESKDALDKWRISKSHKGAYILRRVFSQFIREIVEGMIGYVRLPTIMAKLLSDNGGQEFGDFKLTILGMLGTYGFERRILDTAKFLIEDDTFYTMSLLRKGASHGYAPKNLVCCICGCPFTKESGTSTIRVFNCGHATHIQCEFQENGGGLNRGSSAGCPVCLPKKKIQRGKSKSHTNENGLVKNSPSRPQLAQGTTATQYPHETDASEKQPYVVQQISRFEILSNLQKAQKSLQIENVYQLRLAPPAIYHEKVKKGTDILTGETSIGIVPARSEKPSKNTQFRDLKMKGSSIRFPLRSTIFGTDKTRHR